MVIYGCRGSSMLLMGLRRAINRGSKWKLGRYHPWAKGVVVDAPEHVVGLTVSATSPEQARDVLFDAFGGGHERPQGAAHPCGHRRQWVLQPAGSFQYAWSRSRPPLGRRLPRFAWAVWVITGWLFWRVTGTDTRFCLPRCLLQQTFLRSSAWGSPKSSRCPPLGPYAKKSCPGTWCSPDSLSTGPRGACRRCTDAGWLFTRAWQIPSIPA